MGTASSKTQDGFPQRMPEVPEFPLKAILLGSPFSGRSCVFDRYINNRFDYQSTTSPSSLRIGTKVWLLSDPTAGIAFLNLWDTPREVSPKTGGPGFWAGAKIIFICVSGKEVTNVEDEVVKWTTSSVVRRAYEKDGAIVCVLITKADALQETQQLTITEAMNRLIRTPGLAVDTWTFCSAKDTRGLQGAQDVIKLLFYEQVKNEARRKRRERRNSRTPRSFVGASETIRQSIVSLATRTYEASLKEMAKSENKDRERSHHVFMQ